MPRAGGKDDWLGCEFSWFAVADLSGATTRVALWGKLRWDSPKSGGLGSGWRASGLASHNRSIERTHDGEAQWRAPATLAAPLCAAHVER